MSTTVALMKEEYDSRVELYDHYNVGQYQRPIQPLQEAADVIIQALTHRTDTGAFDFRNLAVVGGSYVILAIAALFFSCSRVLTVRSALQDIPKLYVPIKKGDLPKKVCMKIQQGFQQVKEVRKRAEPLPEDIGQVGRAKPGTPLFDVDFKQAIARTPTIIGVFAEKAAVEIDPDYTRPTCVSVRQYIEFLMQRELIDAHLGQVYLEGYERARFSKAAMTQEEYLDIMKHLAAILNHMGYRLQNGDDSSSVSSSGSTIHRRHNRIQEDDVVSLAQSVATWTSRRSAHANGSRKPHTLSRASSSVTGANDYDDDEEMRLIIYERLMIDRLKASVDSRS
ncbi:hypothetical protein EC973_004346 [Apophysomyces ossiformis]|uniref:Defect at low temperature protein 1 n=1 Tax=Apophysomyces ossiformis TaxID=679940 RepID=A0A8H7ELS6_9FUNG|nr:hypothetical protein EC973_004346 [Apophysomyces ossiformis]